MSTVARFATKDVQLNVLRTPIQNLLQCETKRKGFIAVGESREGKAAARADSEMVALFVGGDSWLSSWLLHLLFRLLRPFL